MSESREYYSRSEEYGDVYISEEVLEMIAGAAALDVDGVTGLSGGTMSEQILGRKKLSKGITILWESDNITINVSIQIRYGGIIPEIAKKVQEAIISSVEDTSGLKVAAVIDAAAAIDGAQADPDVAAALEGNQVVKEF